MTSVTPPGLPARDPTLLPPRVVLDPLPRLLVYDCCPFCVRVRHFLGLKNIKHDLTFVLYDDSATPISLIGKRLLPIFQPTGPGGPAVPESLDICRAVDADPRYGPPGLLRAASDRTDLAALFADILSPLVSLRRPRFARMPLLPEMAHEDARVFFSKGHTLKHPERTYDEAFAKSAEYIAQITARLGELADMIFCKEYITEGGLSYDDIVYFPDLRAMTCVKGLELPAKIREYLEFQAVQADLPLFDALAI